ncbi:hypothetical protein [Streptomyces wuyuanensis]|uniref:PH domain-containing protein n=1 Tax=Streptomyces wuyuanensis TaxID=1196353 RepID=A0A1G9TDF4_9ACTN|nr:hypothetical protein [Streptomyces wuyuanensis]SDM45632.1 hypothetical protein SAMN05444921_108209 [Streptomyces wuyuanensis]
MSEAEFTAAMPEPEFSATGVRIERWPRSLTTAGQVLVEGGRLALLTSYGRVIDSAPVQAVRVGKPWFAGGDSAVATVNGTRYRLTLSGARQDLGDGALTGRLLEVLRKAGGGPG